MPQFFVPAYLVVSASDAEAAIGRAASLCIDANTAARAAVFPGRVYLDEIMPAARVPDGRKPWSSIAEAYEIPAAGVKA